MGTTTKPIRMRISNQDGTTPEVRAYLIAANCPTAIVVHKQGRAWVPTHYATGRRYGAACYTKADAIAEAIQEIRIQHANGNLAKAIERLTQEQRQLNQEPQP